ncbi:MAG: hypothetical protein IJM55_02680 [Ruminococcus sp.]|nr:hypothetical protein [Ruminococcus sp.]
MKIMYYDIHDCDYEFLDGKPAIIAPQDTDVELLKKFDFVQLLDGRWCHYMTLDEKLYMKNNKGKEILIFCNIEETFKRISKQEKHNARVHAVIIISVLLIINILILLLIQVRCETEKIDRENRRKEFWSQFDCENAGDWAGSQYIKLIRWESP